MHNYEYARQYISSGATDERILLGGCEEDARVYGAQACQTIRAGMARRSAVCQTDYRQVLKLQMIVVFISVVALAIIVTGYPFNLVL
jgi:hypothetical protein